jgi:hypothetical protein
MAMNLLHYCTKIKALAHNLQEETTNGYATYFHNAIS